MKISELLKEEKQYEWRIYTSSSDDAPAVCAFVDYKGTGKFEYQPLFVKALEKTYEYYNQQVANFGDRIEFGGERTKRKVFDNREEVNEYLKKLGLPQISDKLFDEIRLNKAVLATKSGLGYNHYHVIDKDTLEEFKKDSTEEEFYAKIMKVIFGKTKGWLGGGYRKITDLTMESRSVLKDFYDSGHLPSN